MIFSGAANQGDFLSVVFFFAGVIFTFLVSVDMARAKMANITVLRALSKVSPTSGKGK